jgi:hypothetical protein
MVPRLGIGPNLLVLALAVPAAFTVYLIVGETFGDVYHSGESNPGTRAIALIVTIVYVSAILYVLFLPGLLLYLAILRMLLRHDAVRGRVRVASVALSPLVAALYVVIPAVPQDEQGNVSGWLFILCTTTIVGVFGRPPSGGETSRSP